MNENDETREETLQDSGEETMQDSREEAPAPQPTNYLMTGIIYYLCGGGRGGLDSLCEI